MILVWERVKGERYIETRQSTMGSEATQILSTRSKIWVQERLCLRISVIVAIICGWAMLTMP